MAESPTQSIGRVTERLSEAHLLSKGLKTVARNYQCRCGEVDLIMLESGTLVFVEVRYRRSKRFGSAAASVDRRKQRKLTNTAAIFLAANPAYRDYPVRFDVVGLDGPNTRQFTIQWYRDAFRPQSRGY